MLAAITTTPTKNVSNNKSDMNLKNALFGLLLLGLPSCSSDKLEINTFEDNATITTLNGTWKVLSFENYSSNTREFKTQENSRGYDIIIKFDDTKNPKELSGSNTTNTIFGKFDYSTTRKFKVTELGRTQVTQPRWADEFSKAILDNDISFKINLSGLRVYYENKAKSVTFTRQ